MNISSSAVRYIESDLDFKIYGKSSAKWNKKRRSKKMNSAAKVDRESRRTNRKEKQELEDENSALKQLCRKKEELIVDSRIAQELADAEEHFHKEEIGKLQRDSFSVIPVLVDLNVKNERLLTNLSATRSGMGMLVGHLRQENENQKTEHAKTISQLEQEKAQLKVLNRSLRKKNTKKDDEIEKLKAKVTMIEKREKKLKKKLEKENTDAFDTIYNLLHISLAYVTPDLE